MPEHAEKLIMENINKQVSFQDIFHLSDLYLIFRNAVDLDEYPATQVIHNRCVSMSTCSFFYSFFFYLRPSLAMLTTFSMATFLFFLFLVFLLIVDSVD